MALVAPFLGGGRVNADQGDSELAYFDGGMFHKRVTARTSLASGPRLACTVLCCAIAWLCPTLPLLGNA
jgi:hypothetical protein